MVIEKVWQLKEGNLGELKKRDDWQDIYEDTLFLSIESAISITGFSADNFISMVEIAYNDGDFASLCTVDNLEAEYKRMLRFEPDEIEGIPRKEGEAYFLRDCEVPVSLPMEEIKKLLSA